GRRSPQRDARPPRALRRLVRRRHRVDVSYMLSPGCMAGLLTLARSAHAGQPESQLVCSGGSMGAKLFGASVLRKEDPRFLPGEGRYADDIKLPGMLHAAFVRSPYAHAVVRSVKTEAARRLRGVAHAFAFADLQRWMKPLPLFGAIPPGL